MSSYLAGFVAGVMVAAVTVWVVLFMFVLPGCTTSDAAELSIEYGDETLEARVLRLERGALELEKQVIAIEMQVVELEMKVATLEMKVVAPETQAIEIEQQQPRVYTMLNFEYNNCRTNSWGASAVNMAEAVESEAAQAEEPITQGANDE